MGKMDELETIQASKLNLRIGNLPDEIIPVIRKKHLESDFIVYLTKKEELETKSKINDVWLWYPSFEGNIIIMPKELRRFAGLVEDSEKLFRIVP